MIRAVFMGSPAFAVPSLEALRGIAEVALVVTQPDKPSGRGRAVTAPPVKVAAEAAGIPVFQPKSAKTEAFLATVKAAGADIAIVVAYGKILPPAVLAAFPLGCLNVHASLLPAYRGAAPIQWAVIHGEATTGVAIMQLEAGLDTGPVFAERRVAIGATETGGALMDRLAHVGAEALATALPAIAKGELLAVPQDHARATYAPLFTKGHGGVDFARTAAQVASLVRGVDPWPGAFARHRGEVMKLFGATETAQVASGAPAAPGTVTSIEVAGMTVACGQGYVLLKEVQPAGRRRMSPVDLVAGRGIAVGDILETPDDAVLRA